MLLFLTKKNAGKNACYGNKKKLIKITFSFFLLLILLYPFFNFYRYNVKANEIFKSFIWLIFGYNVRKVICFCNPPNFVNFPPFIKFAESYNIYYKAFFRYCPKLNKALVKQQIIYANYHIKPANYAVNFTCKNIAYYPFALNEAPMQYISNNLKAIFLLYALFNAKNNQKANLLYCLNLTYYWFAYQ
ncbi:hypothetical protein GGTG_11557 [Gaeumannomyces tritici R3-111a-1]|uniref:Uncharacterized protein n=1 Tax=Gaeumannomyces tritici (strain R3-111a-1) TaxID=644352 RepID=J3PDI4_GAET3|nr:hypothetical protein GGTG_11557 [Gaeumannomyces tritici R3-111a-1]EJT70534.1 hypothetical protein GGTG_11557 [Gaeumannomyces tritici R3-111a-1]